MLSCPVGSSGHEKMMIIHKEKAVIPVTFLMKMNRLTIMKFTLIFFISLMFSVSVSYSQFLIPGEGYADIRVGLDWDEIEWELGFRGVKIDKKDLDKELILVAEKAGIDYDFVVNYQYIMWAPVTKLFFKDNVVVMFQMSSYPEYNKMLCADIGTVDGLNFWDDEKAIKKIYGDIPSFSYEKKTFFLAKNKGLVIEVKDGEVRSLFIFKPEMK